NQVYEAYKAVKSNAGSAGVDGQTIEQFDSDLRNNLYKLWNRMSSGSRCSDISWSTTPCRRCGAVRRSLTSCSSKNGSTRHEYELYLAVKDIDPDYVACHNNTALIFLGMRA